MSEGSRDQNTQATSRTQNLLERARRAYFDGKISQAAYLWEKVLDGDPENEEAQSCRSYVRRNSIALRAVALGKDIKVPPPPRFLDPANRLQEKVDGPKRHSSTEDLEWSDLGFGGEPRDRTSASEDKSSATPGQGESVGFGSRAESAPSFQKGARDTSRITTRFKPEEVSGKELVEGLQPATEMGEMSGPGTDGLDTSCPSGGEPREGELAPEPKPSTTLSGMPTSRLMPKDLFDPDAAQFAHPVSSVETASTAMSPQEAVSPSISIQPDESEHPPEHPPEPPPGPVDETEHGESDKEEPDEEPGGSEDLEIQPADLRSEALLDPEKGLRHARELFDRGEHTDSLELCEILADALPDDEVRTTLMAKNLEILEALYLERLGDPETVPRVDLAQGNLQDIQMDHKTAFLLTRIDGTLTIEEILDIAGMSRFEAVKNLVQALEEGIICID